MQIEDVYGDLPILETDRLVLRKLEQKDEDDIFQYCSDEEVSKYTIWYAHKSMEDTRSYLNMVFDKYNNKSVSPWGVLDKTTGKIIGTTGFISWDTKNAKAELGYALSREFWNRGYMSEAVASVIAFGFERMKLVRIEARCHPHNTGSYRVMEKAGMAFEGILRKHIFAKGIYEDVRMYSIIKEDLGSGSNNV